MSIEEPLKTSLRLLVLPIMNKESTPSLLGDSRRPSNMLPINLGKIMHHATHASAEQIVNICRDAGWLNPEWNDAI